jgi:hypothetical protein
MKMDETDDEDNIIIKVITSTQLSSSRLASPKGFIKFRKLIFEIIVKTNSENYLFFLFCKYLY